MCQYSITYRHTSSGSDVSFVPFIKIAVEIRIVSLDQMVLKAFELDERQGISEPCDKIEIFQIVQDKICKIYKVVRMC